MISPSRTKILKGGGCATDVIVTTLIVRPDCAMTAAPAPDGRPGGCSRRAALGRPGMPSKTWAATCVCLTLVQSISGQTSQKAVDIFVTNERSLSVPVNIQESRRAELRELVLYASNDQGRTWRQVA